MPQDLSAVAIIPGRLGSTRFPGKVLKADTGKPMIVHVCEQAARASLVHRVVVATDAPEIEEAVRAHGFEAVMTGEHPNGSSRLAEAAAALGLDDLQRIVNVQGDEPEIEPETIDAAIEAPERASGESVVGTVATPIEDAHQVASADVVKAVTGLVDPVAGVGRALYFSRSSIPHGSERVLRHVGIYSYSVGSLRAYLDLEPSPHEQTERLEQLRWLEHGYGIAVAIRSTDHTGVDTEAQYRAFVTRYLARSTGK